MGEPAESFCKACSSLNLSRTDFELPASVPIDRFGKVVLVGTVASLKSNSPKCQLCRLILRALQLNQVRNPQSLRGSAKWELTRSTSTIEYGHLLRAATKKLVGSALYPMLKVPLAGRFYGIQLIDEKSTSSLLRGRLVDDEPDVAMLRGWIKRCQTEHGASCRQTYLHIHESPCDMLFIDAESECLVRLPSDTAYVALSYVWGGANKKMTLTSNLKQFMQLNGLLRRDLPKIISDALEVTNALDYRYLWVDAFCIVQNDDVSKKAMIESMDSVYGNAVITIIAASGGQANAGLSGWNKASRKPPGENVETIRPGFRIGLLPFFENELEDSPYSSRGWT
ncbi:MAG: hypothetical protein M1821_009676 [Bathelium mastoideum]|nr:MAG: hypothetical protein M1821_009676 [Bathelium mastoideum]